MKVQEIAMFYVRGQVKARFCLQPLPEVSEVWKYCFLRYKWGSLFSSNGWSRSGGVYICRQEKETKYNKEEKNLNFFLLPNRVLVIVGSILETSYQLFTMYLILLHTTTPYNFTSMPYSLCYIVWVMVAKLFVFAFFLYGKIFTLVGWKIVTFRACLEIWLISYKCFKKIKDYLLIWDQMDT